MEKFINVEFSPWKVDGGYYDRFLYPCSSVDGLPPYARAIAIYKVFDELRRERSWACLWVCVYGPPGDWYVNELRMYFVDCELPICITKQGREPLVTDFLGQLTILKVKPKKPDFIELVYWEDSAEVKDSAQFRILRALARMEFATSRQVGSMAGYGETQVRKYLSRLEEDGLVKYHEKGIKGKIKYAVWEITRFGIQDVHWSWNVPPGTRFKSTREEQKVSGVDHRKRSRLFPAWIKEAYGDAFEIYQAWTELSVNGMEIFPDTIVWGSYWGYETIIWLETETGHKSCVTHAEKIVSKYNQAKAIAKQQNVQLVFVVLAMPWVLNAIQNYGLFEIPEYAAVIMEYWGHDGCLAKPIFGGFNSLTGPLGYPMIKNLSMELKKDPEYFLPKLNPEIRELIAADQHPNSKSDRTP